MVTQAMTSADPPDWSAIREDIRCPLCKYDLHECVLRFRRLRHYMSDDDGSHDPIRI